MIKDFPGIHSRRQFLSRTSPDPRGSIVQRILARKDSFCPEVSHQPLPGGFAVLSSFRGFYAESKIACLLGDFNQDSLMLAGNVTSCTEAVSACTAIGISNGNEALICHFDPTILALHKDLVIERIGEIIQFLGTTGSRSLRAVIYSGHNSNGLPLESLMKEKGIESLVLMEQKRGFGGGILYNPRTNLWHINTYCYEKENREPVHSFMEASDIKNVSELSNCFGRIEHIPAKN